MLLEKEVKLCQENVKLQVSAQKVAMHVHTQTSQPAVFGMLIYKNIKLTSMAKWSLSR